MPVNLFRTYLLLAAVCFLQFNAPAALGEEPDFRAVRWGMTVDEVRAAETATFVTQNAGNPKSDVTLVYECTIGNEPCMLYCEFNNLGRLYGSFYSFTAVPFERIYDFDAKLRATLDRKYPQDSATREPDYWVAAHTDIELSVVDDHPDVQYLSRTVPT